MTLFLILFTALFLCSIVLILISFTPWAQQRLRWITSLFFYLIVGGLLGISLMGVSISVARLLTPLALTIAAV